MGLGINLRFDLMRLSDTQLAALLDECWQRYEAARESAAPLVVLSSGRGLIRHAWAYPFVSVLMYGRSFLWAFGLAVECSLAGLISARDRAIMQMHLALCDIADIEDEIRRRLR